MYPKLVSNLVSELEDHLKIGENTLAGLDFTVTERGFEIIKEFAHLRIQNIDLPKNIVILLSLIAGTIMNGLHFKSKWVTIPTIGRPEEWKDLKEICFLS